MNPRQPISEDLRKTIERLDALLASTQDIERLRMGMGIRLALGMAEELKSGAPLGSRTGDMVAAWTEEHGQDTVDMAVRIAREFLTKPEELRKALGQRLGVDGEGEPGSLEPAGSSEPEDPQVTSGGDDRDGFDETGDREGSQG